MRARQRKREGGDGYLDGWDSWIRNVLDFIRFTGYVTFEKSRITWGKKRKRFDSQYPK